jgi:hypothetical protein
MFKRIKASWQLVKASANVLRTDKELIVFPMVSSVGVFIVTIGFLLPMVAATMADTQISGGGSEGLGPVGYAVMFLFYLVVYFVIFFANTALVGAAMIRLRGGNPTLADGFGIAFKNVGAIFGYALISATVGMVLRFISERAGILGRFVSSLFGMAWNLATYLVVPILVIEGVGPIKAIKRSTQLLKETWGEQIAGNVGIGAVFGFIGLLVLLISIPLIIFTAVIEAYLLMGVVIAMFILSLVAIGLVGSTLSGIYQAAVYQYVVAGDPGSYFSEDMIRDSFYLKKKK